MKVMQINSVYNYGSTGKITHDLHHALLKEGIDSVVYYGRRFPTEDEGVHKFCSEPYSKFNNALSRVTGLMYGGCYFSTNRLISAIEREKPDVVHLQCLNGYFVNVYRLIAYLKERQIPTVLTLHAEFMYTGNCGHAMDCERWKTGCGHCPRWRKETKSLFFDRTAESWRRMKAAFEGFDKLKVVSVSPWLMERARQSPMLVDKEHSVIYNGVGTAVFHCYETRELRRELGITENEAVVFHATPMFNLNPRHIKGGYYVTETAKRFAGEPVRFVVAGRYDKAEIYPENMLMLGEIKDQIQLAKLYSLADVTLLTSKKETFSMVCAESLCCGTPVVGFKAGAPEMISLPEYSRFVEYGDVGALENEVRRFLSTGKNGEISDRASAVYSMETMVRQFVDCYQKAVANNQ